MPSNGLWLSGSGHSGGNGESEVLLGSDGLSRFVQMLLLCEVNWLTDSLCGSYMTNDDLTRSRAGTLGSGRG
jgi:hypothetical protein